MFSKSGKVYAPFHLLPFQELLLYDSVCCYRTLLVASTTHKKKIKIWNTQPYMVKDHCLFAVFSHDIAEIVFITNCSGHNYLD